MTKRSKRTREQREMVLVERGWSFAGNGTWTHPRCAFAWPEHMALTLEEEDATPLATRADPWRSVAGKSVERMLADAARLRARPLAGRR